MTQITRQSITYDNTKIAAYKKCPRSFFIRHILGWTRTGNAPALAFGGSWHEAMDVVWKNATKMSHEDLTHNAFMAFCAKFREDGFEVSPDMELEKQMQPRTPGNAHEMLYEYIKQRWTILQTFELIECEKPFAVPMPGHEDTWYIGRLDKVVKDNYGTPLVIEHKTTTAYAKATGFRTDYIDSWYSASQVKGYEFAGTLLYENIAGVWVDASLVHRTEHGTFKFVPIKHSSPLVLEWVAGTSTWIKKIQNDRDVYEEEKKLHKDIFIKNEDSCYGKFGACPFIDICRACADPSQLKEVPDGFVEQHWEPFDVLKIDKLLENSDES